MNEPIDFATADTVGFLTQHLDPGVQLIEVGCGEGHVAQALHERGYGVLGLDADSETVASAKKRGAPVTLATWPAFDSSAVDAIASHLDRCITSGICRVLCKRRDTLKPQGKLLIEDFAFDAIDEPTIDWLIGIVRDRQRVGMDTSGFIGELIAAANPLGVWRQHHEAHGVHAGTAMSAVSPSASGIEQASAVPYLYRYLIPALPATPDAALVLQQVGRDELQRGNAAQIELIGRRIVAVPIAR